jgi:DNA mismatch repair protein MutL
VTLLVNSRWVQSKALLAAFEEGYRPLLPRGRHPLAVLFLSVPRSHLDVNVHPSKAEVKIRGEAEIAGALKLAVRAALGRNLSAPPDLSFTLGPTQFELPRMVAERGPEWNAATGRRLRSMRVGGQVQGSLILLEDERGMYLVDQHRAHERAIYELLLSRHAAGRAGQLLLEPLHLELSARQLARLEPRLPELASLGFSCEWFGGQSFLVRSVPVIPEAADLPSMIEDLLDLATEDDGVPDWQHRVLTSVACRTATRRGKALTLEQCRELIELLAETESPAVCPHGSPIILHFSDRFLERQFDW